MYGEIEMEFKPGHLKILRALAERDGLTKEDLARVVRDRNLAVKYRKELLRAGFIHQDEDDRFHLAARSYEWLYFSEVLELFEQAVLKGKGRLLLEETCDIRVFEKDAPHVEGLSLKLGALGDLFRLEELSEDDRRLIAEIMALNNVEVRRSALLLREAILEVRKRMVLLSFPEDRRSLVFDYDDKLSEFLTLCLRILYTKHPKYGESNKRFLALMDEVGRSLRQKLRDPGERRRWKFIIERYGLPPRRFGEQVFEDVISALVKLIKEETISDRNSLLDCIRIYLEECEKLVDGEERSRLHELYHYLTEDRERLNAYCEFLGRLAGLPREIYIVPIGFRGYIRKFLHVIGSGMRMPEDMRGTFKGMFDSFKESIKYLLPPYRLFSPLLLQGIGENTRDIEDDGE